VIFEYIHNPSVLNNFCIHQKGDPLPHFIAASGPFASAFLFNSGRFPGMIAAPAFL
jgi:hypothetical protein